MFQRKHVLICIVIKILECCGGAIIARVFQWNSSMYKLLILFFPNINYEIIVVCFLVIRSKTHLKFIRINLLGKHIVIAAIIWLNKAETAQTGHPSNCFSTRLSWRKKAYFGHCRDYVNDCNFTNISCCTASVNQN